MSIIEVVDDLIALRELALHKDDPPAASFAE